MPHCLVDNGFKIFIPNSIGNQDPYMFLPSTEPFLSYIWELRQIFEMYHFTSITCKFPVDFHHNNITSLKVPIWKRNTC